MSADPLAVLGLPNDSAQLAEEWPPVGEGEESKPFVIRTCFADVEPESVEWLWPGRIPFGKLTLIAGDPGLGKSFLTLAIAAAYSRGAPWPDRPGEPTQPGNTVILSAEDDPADTIRPRLDAAEADVRRIYAITGAVHRRGSDPVPVCLASDLRLLEDAIVDVGARLCVVDPISAYLGNRDADGNADVRALLHPLSEMAARNRCALVVVTHLRKSGADRAVYRAIGSIAFTAAARIAWLVAKDKDDDHRRIMAPLKCNLIEEPKGMAFRIEEGRVLWEAGEVTVDAESLLAPDGADRTERDKAVEWLQDYLLTGPAPVSEIEKAAKADCHAWRTIERAKKSLRIVSERDDYETKKGEKKWRFVWSVPAES